jgi:hypothetical protein
MTLSAPCWFSQDYNFNVGFENKIDGAIHDPNLVLTLSSVFKNNPCNSDGTYKLLGVYLGDNLDLNTHIINLTNRLCRSFFFFYGLKT